MSFQAGRVNRVSCAKTDRSKRVPSLVLVAFNQPIGQIAECLFVTRHACATWLKWLVVMGAWEA
jgi:hypothetical protein